MTLLDFVVPTYTQMLQALSNWVDKATAQQGVGVADDLLAARLAPDMFPLATQIRFSCVQALEGWSRLQGRDFPPVVQELLDEGRNASESPGTIAAAKSRIAETIDLLERGTAAAQCLAPEAAVAHALPNGMIFDLTARQYVRDWALPQFYFHVVTTYAILRAEGIDLGKVDYVSHMFAFLRPGTLPPGGTDDAVPRRHEGTGEGGPAPEAVTDAAKPSST